MSKLIILEGPDNMGKTTLALKIADQIDAVYLHGVKVGDEVHQNKYHDNLLDIARDNMQLGKTVIIDRHWISHLVYSGYNGMNQCSEYAKKFSEKIRELKGSYIFCYSIRGENTYAEKIDLEHPYSVEQYEEYCRRYRDMYLSFKSGPDAPRVFEYDFTWHGATKANLDHFINLILEV